MNIIVEFLLMSLKNNLKGEIFPWKNTHQFSNSGKCYSCTLFEKLFVHLNLSSRTEKNQSHFRIRYREIGYISNKGQFFKSFLVVVTVRRQINLIKIERNDQSFQRKYNLANIFWNKERYSHESSLKPVSGLCEHFSHNSHNK